MQRELEERDRILQRESERLHQLDIIYKRALQEKRALEDLLTRRNSIITHLMEKLEVREKGEGIKDGNGKTYINVKRYTEYPRTQGCDGECLVTSSN